MTIGCQALSGPTLTFHSLVHKISQTTRPQNWISNVTDSLGQGFTVTDSELTKIINNYFKKLQIHKNTDLRIKLIVNSKSMNKLVTYLYNMACSL